ncbi:hypothetical protein LOD99_1146 [Oopsacas minuta]|uniref:Uncharacterized protein n=1 Tax=Oopsacas minuta TaxID=111878 RepID=A0AAV7K568_9METZ|nr:hypothetical protein LOD99_1146 [Oopsacas minuta]
MVAKEQEFELELAWCISQLEVSVNDKRVSKKQNEENARIARQLASPKTPFPRKRQLMRSTFGDYRAKMKSHPLPELSRPSVCKKQEPDGMFYKVSGSKTHEGGTTDSPNDPFKFQFNIES